jgi:hypothetical protein
MQLMNKINLASILKIIDIKNLISVFLVVVVFFGVNTFVVKPRENSNKASQAEIDEVSKETESIVTQTEEILAGGSDSIGDVINKLSAYENVLPKSKIDALELELALRTIAGDALEITSIAQPEEVSTASDDTIAQYDLYKINGVSSIGILEQFISIISFTSISSGTVIITVESMSINVTKPKNSSSSELFDLQSSPNVDFEILVRIWYNSEKGILNEAAEKAAASALAIDEAKNKEGSSEGNTDTPADAPLDAPTDQN